MIELMKIFCLHFVGVFEHYIQLVPKLSKWSKLIKATPKREEFLRDF